MLKPELKLFNLVGFYQLKLKSMKSGFQASQKNQDGDKQLIPPFLKPHLPIHRMVMHSTSNLTQKTNSFNIASNSCKGAKTENTRPCVNKFLKHIKHITSSLATLKSLFFIFSAGFFDAINISSSFYFLKSSKILVDHFLRCVIVNNIILFGLINFIRKILIPVLESFVATMSSFLLTNGNIKTSYFTILIYKTHWENFSKIYIYMLLFISFFINSIWYREIANQAFIILPKIQCAHKFKLIDFNNSNIKGATKQISLRENIDNRLSKTIIPDIIIRKLFRIVWLIHIQVMWYIPYIGIYLYWIYLTWLISFYAFEHRWQHLSFSTEDSLIHFEDHSIYYLAFGLPYAITLSIISPLLDWSLLSIIFPFCILQSIQSSPISNSQLYPKLLGNLSLLAPLEWEFKSIILNIEKMFTQVLKIVLVQSSAASGKC